ncbi:MAG: hypothetical protein ABIQ55_10940, partial [Gemmatimonadaceae bacterium]
MNPRAENLHATDRDRLTAATFAGITSILLGLLYWMSRIGFANPIRPVAISVGIALFVIALPAVMTSFRQSAFGATEEWWGSQMVIMLVAFAFTALAGFAVHVVHVNAGVPIALIGTVSFVVVFFRWLRGSTLLPAAGVVVFASVMAVWIGGVTWGTRYKTPVFWETIGNRGNVHHDPLYNVAIANMMRAYGKPSTGLDGLAYIPYHY